MKKLLVGLLALALLPTCAACRKEAEEPTVSGDVVSDTDIIEEAAPASDTDVAEGTMSFADYQAAGLDSPVVVDVYVQAVQSWQDGRATLYAASNGGAFLITDMECSDEQYRQLTPGAKIRVSGYKTEDNGSVRIVRATFVPLEGSYVAEAADLTDLLGTDALLDHQNELAVFKGLTVEASVTDSGAEKAFWYGWYDGSSAGQNADLYFNASINGKTCNFCVKTDLSPEGSEVYSAVEKLKIGDVIDVEAFLNWEEGANPFVTRLTVR